MAKEPAKKKENKEKKENKNFFKEFRAELKRVSWPTPKQLVNNTAVVVAIVVLVAVIVFVLDVIFENLNSFGVERLKALVTSSSTETEETEDATGDSELVLDDGTVEEGDSQEEPEEGSEESESEAEEVPEETETTTEETTEEAEGSVEEN